MEINITAIVTVVGVIIGATWKLSRHLHNIEISLTELKGTNVTHEQCSERRSKCPCIKDIDNLKKRVEDLKDLTIKK